MGKAGIGTMSDIRIIVTYPDGRKEDVTNSITDLQISVTSGERWKELKKHLPALNEILDRNQARYYEGLRRRNGY